MLKKLMKYEMPAVAKRLLPLYGALFAVSILFGFALRTDKAGDPSEFILVIMAMLFAGVVTSVFVMSIIVMIQRYKDNLLGDGGYFTLTLPVKNSTHLMNKTLSAGIWTTIGCVGAAIAGILLSLAAGIWSFRDLIDLLSLPFIEGWKVIVTILEFLIMVFVGGCKTGLQVYTAITIGRQASKRTGLVSLAVYIGLGIFETTILNIARMTGVLDSWLELLAYMDGWADWNVFVLITVIVIAAFSALYFFVTKWFLDNKLNLA